VEKHVAHLYEQARNSMNKSILLLLGLLSGAAIAGSPSNGNLDWHFSTVNQHLFVDLRNLTPDTPVDMTSIDVAEEQPDCPDNLCNAKPIHRLVDYPNGLSIQNEWVRFDLGSVKSIIGRDGILADGLISGACNPAVVVSINVAYPAYNAVQSNLIGLCGIPAQ